MAEPPLAPAGAPKVMLEVRPLADDAERRLDQLVKPISERWRDQMIVGLKTSVANAVLHSNEPDAPAREAEEVFCERVRQHLAVYETEAREQLRSWSELCARLDMSAAFEGQIFSRFSPLEESIIAQGRAVVNAALLARHEQLGRPASVSPELLVGRVLLARAREGMIGKVA